MKTTATRNDPRKVATTLEPFVNAVLMTRALAELERERVDVIQRQVLADDHVIGGGR